MALDFAQQWKKITDELVRSMQKNIFIFAIGLAIVILLGGGWFGYRYFALQKEQEATLILADCLSEFQNVSQGKGSWDAVASLCNASYEKFKKTSIAPYILVVYVDVLLQQEKKDQALEQLNLALTQLSKSSPMYPIYALKQAVLKIESEQNNLHEEGFLQLKDLATDKQNIYNDAAQYYLGLYFQENNNLEKAKEIWNQLAQLNEVVTQESARSPWSAMAQEKLQGLA